MSTFASYGKAVHFSKLLFYCVSYYSSQMLFPCCDVMHSKSGSSLVKFNFVVMYALKIKSMATMDITAAQLNTQRRIKTFFSQLFHLKRWSLLLYYFKHSELLKWKKKEASLESCLMKKTFVNVFQAKVLTAK